MQTRSRELFQSIRTEGGLLPAELLRRIAEADSDIPGLTADSYHLATGERLGEAASRAWNRLLGAWAAFDTQRAQLPSDDTGSQLTRERWLHVLFDSLGYGRLAKQPAVVIDGKSYPIFSQWQHTPIHLVGCNVAIDRRSAGVAGAAGQSPHSLVQELLNRSPERLWGLVSNGLRLRLIRDNVALTRQAYVEFDLEAMMRGEAFSDFVVLWLVCHQSRVEGDKPETCWLEQWSTVAASQGARALDALRSGVEEAIATLGRGFLAHPENQALQAVLQSGELDARDYYRQLLRLVYRLLFLFVAEDRDALLDPAATTNARARYVTHYSTQRLRHLADKRRGGPQRDLYSGLGFVMAQLAVAGCKALGLPGLGSYLWSPDAVGLLADSHLANSALLEALRALAWVEEGGVHRAVDFRNLGAEELGSVYESLLELHPELQRETATFTLNAVAGSERRTSGSYYTPTDLITALLDTALEPVLERAAQSAYPEAAILQVTVCDPACGSGHFLIAAANRIGKRLATIRTGDTEPAPTALRHAIRDAIGSCIYGVDMNPMAVELCKVSLWMEALDPGRPLSFLDDRIVCGNSLIGATTELISKGIPRDAFKALLGDDKDIVTALRQRNARERAGQASLDVTTGVLQADSALLARMAGLMAQVRDDSMAGLDERERQFDALVSSPEHERARLLADIWSAAFVSPKRRGSPAITQETLRRAAASGSASLTPEEHTVITAARDLYRFHHWHLAFPAVFAAGGFDVVIGNPPWEHTELKEKEFFASRAPEIAKAPNKALREELIEALATDEPELFAEFARAKRSADGWSHFLRSSARYPLCGRGRTNTYAMFAELMQRIVNTNGRVGAILPTGIATDDTTKHFFRDLVDRRVLVSLFSFENEEFVFPQVHHATKFCLLTLAGAAVEFPPTFVFFARKVADLADGWRRFQLSADDIALLNPNTRTCPTFRSGRDATVTKAIYERVPPLVREGSADGDPWGLVLTQGLFNMSTDSSLFMAAPEGHSLPLYEGKMLWQFDHRYGTYECQTQAQAKQGTLPTVSDQQHRDASFTVKPRYWVAARETERQIAEKSLPSWFIVFRDITSAVVNRTIVASALPAVAVGNNAPLVTLLQATHAERLAFLGCVNSFAADYTCRQKVGGSHLNFFLFKQVAIPSPAQLRTSCPWAPDESYVDFLAPRVLELVYTAYDLDAISDESANLTAPYRWDEARRTMIRAELDAAMFYAYGLDRAEIDHIMSMFPIAEAYEVANHGEFRQRRLIMERYEEMALATSTDRRYVTPLDPAPGDIRLTHAPRPPTAI